MDGKNVLIADDETGVREAFRMILKDKYNLFLYDNGEEALNCARNHRIDVALVDIKMPKMDGLELLKKIKTIDHDIQVIMVTGYATLDTAIEAMRFGAFDYIKKPFDKDELEKLVEKGIDRKRLKVKVKKDARQLASIRETLGFDPSK